MASKHYIALKSQSSDAIFKYNEDDVTTYAIYYVPNCKASNKCVEAVHQKEAARKLGLLVDVTKSYYEKPLQFA